MAPPKARSEGSGSDQQTDQNESSDSPESPSDNREAFRRAGEAAETGAPVEDAELKPAENDRTDETAQISTEQARPRAPSNGGGGSGDSGGDGAPSDGPQPEPIGGRDGSDAGNSTSGGSSGSDGSDGLPEDSVTRDRPDPTGGSSGDGSSTGGSSDGGSSGGDGSSSPIESGTSDDGLVMRGPDGQTVDPEDYSGTDEGPPGTEEIPGEKVERGPIYALEEPVTREEGAPSLESDDAQQAINRAEDQVEDRFGERFDGEVEREDYQLVVREDGSIDARLTDAGRRQLVREQLEEEHPGAESYEIGMEDGGIVGRPVWGDQPSEVETPDGEMTMTNDSVGLSPDTEEYRESRVEAQIERGTDRDVSVSERGDSYYVETEGWDDQPSEAETPDGEMTMTRSEGEGPDIDTEEFREGVVEARVERGSERDVEVEEQADGSFAVEPEDDGSDRYGGSRVSTGGQVGENLVEKELEAEDDISEADVGRGPNNEFDAEVERTVAGDEVIRVDETSDDQDGEFISDSETEDDDGGLVDSAGDVLREAQDLDHRIRNQYHDTRSDARDAFFGFFGTDEVREDIQEKQQEGREQTQAAASTAVSATLNSANTIQETQSEFQEQTDAVGKPLPIFGSAVPGKGVKVALTARTSQAGKVASEARSYINALRGAQRGTIRGSATGSRASSGGSSVAQHGEWVVQGVDRVTDGIRAAGTAGAAAAATSSQTQSEVEVPENPEDVGEPTEIETPETPSGTAEEVEIPERTHVEQGEIGIPDTVDDTEIPVDSSDGRTGTDDGEIEVPAEAEPVGGGGLRDDGEEEQEQSTSSSSTTEEEVVVDPEQEDVDIGERVQQWSQETQERAERRHEAITPPRNQRQLETDEETGHLPPEEEFPSEEAYQREVQRFQEREREEAESATEAIQESDQLVDEEATQVQEDEFADPGETETSELEDAPVVDEDTTQVGGSGFAGSDGLEVSDDDPSEMAPDDEMVVEEEVVETGDQLSLGDEFVGGQSRTDPETVSMMDQDEETSQELESSAADQLGEEMTRSVPDSETVSDTVEAQMSFQQMVQVQPKLDSIQRSLQMTGTPSTPTSSLGETTTPPEDWPGESTPGYPGVPGGPGGPGRPPRRRNLPQLPGDDLELNLGGDASFNAAVGATGGPLTSGWVAETVTAMATMGGPRRPASQSTLEAHADDGWELPTRTMASGSGREQARIAAVTGLLGGISAVEATDGDDQTEEDWSGDWV